ncbi:hypothetical protein Y032_0446g1608 [Ancylostoma ceylanicum]|uniref:Uncharacterized protein n=1 Tax=Ancylostoma ceylanicum TaxID=53326 RepID=A0A016WZ78_9BILA|nr:hypothetical protein Y032_0446g1608 [Ancylostoma ceylanicum]
MRLAIWRKKNSSETSSADFRCRQMHSFSPQFPSNTASKQFLTTVSVLGGINNHPLLLMLVVRCPLKIGADKSKERGCFKISSDFLALDS